MKEAISELEARYEAVLQRVAQASEQVHRNQADITLVAVTKTWPAEMVFAAYELGMRHFGENRAEELAEKRAAVEAELGSENGITWHLIGPLQSRKTPLAAEHADFFHALDRMKIARKLSRHLLEIDRTLPVLLEINVSGEASKHGFDASQWETDEAQRSALVKAARDVITLPNLELRGLMTMAPWDADSEFIQGLFRRTHSLSVWLSEQVPDATWSTLSMGMTDDFELAIEQGATHIRIGRAIFGEREL